MLQLTPAERAKLEGIVAAGGLTDQADVVRVPVAPPDEDTAAVWKRYLSRNHDSLVAITQRVCGPLDLILIDGEVVTVCRHPQTRKAPERIQAEVLALLSERLFGRVVSPMQAAKLMRSRPTPGLKIQMAPPVDEEALPPEMENALRLIAGEELIAPEPEPVPEEPKKLEPALELKMQRVVRTPGINAVWLKASHPAPKPGEPQRDYFRSAVELVDFDIALAQQTEDIAKRMVAERQPPVQLMFPINVNGLRRPEHRSLIVTKLRGLDDRYAARMEPVLVRCEAGVPASVVAEAAGYLRKTFNQVWVFAGRNADPRSFPWSDMKMGVLLSGTDVPKPAMEVWRQTAEKAGWQLGVLA
jgi:hypothetical protein